MGKWDDVERMPVFQDALELGRIAERVAMRIATKRPDIAAQIRRSSGSVALNLGEGAREFSPREKARIYRISQKEAGETSAGFALLEALGLGDEDTTIGRILCRRIVGQLTGLCHAALKRLADAAPLTDLT